MSSDSEAGMREDAPGDGNRGDENEGSAGTPAASGSGNASKPRRTVMSDSDESDAVVSQRKSASRDESDAGNEGDMSATGAGQRGGNMADLGLSTDSDSQSDDGLGVGAARKREPGSASAAGKAAEKSSLNDLFGDSDAERESDDEGVFDDSDRPVRRRDYADGGDAAAAAAAGGSSDGGGGSGAAARPPERDTLRLPVVPRPRSSAGKSAGTGSYVAKLNKSIGLQDRCFDPDTFDPEKEAEEFKMAQSMIRWRLKRDAAGAPQLNADGSPSLETNTRLVKWSDGSFQLMVGGDAYDVMVNPNPRSFLFVQHKSDAAAGAAARGKGGSQGTCLECQGRLPQKMAFNAPLNSRQQQNMALLIRTQEAAASQQRGRVALQEAAPAKDPQWSKEQRIRQSEEQKKSERRRRGGYDKYGAPTGARGSRGGRRAAGMDPRYLEEGDEGDYDTVGAGSIKDDVRRGRYDQNSDDEDSEDDGDRASALLRAKQDSRAAARKRSAARKGGGSGSGGKQRRRSGGGRKKKAADEDDDEDEEDEDEEEEEAEDGDSDEEEEAEDSQAEESSADDGSDGGRGSRKRNSAGKAVAASSAAAAGRGGSGDDEGGGFAPGGDSEEEEEGAGAAAAADRSRQQKRARRTVAQDSDSD